MQCCTTVRANNQTNGLSGPIETLRKGETTVFHIKHILGEPGADSGGQGKSKRAGKYGTKKSKERRESPWGQCLTRPVPNGRRRSAF